MEAGIERPQVPPLPELTGLGDQVQLALGWQRGSAPGSQSPVARGVEIGQGSAESGSPGGGVTGAGLGRAIQAAGRDLPAARILPDAGTTGNVSGPKVPFVNEKARFMLLPVQLSSGFFHRSRVLYCCMDASNNDHIRSEIQAKSNLDSL